MNIIIAILAFGLLVLVHEWGHYMAAVKSGVFVEEFAIGMGPKIVSFTKNETIYSIRALPIGGFCKMLGEDEELKDERAFNSKKVSARIFIILAGVIMNIILAFVLQFIVNTFQGQNTLFVSKVMENYPASASGIETGDELIAINGKKVYTFMDFRMPVLESNGETMQVTYKKPDGTVIEKDMTPMKSEGEYVIGLHPEQKFGAFASSIYPDTVNVSNKLSFSEYVLGSFWDVVGYVKVVANGIVQLFTFNVKMNDMAGPIGVVSVLGDVYEKNVESVGIGFALINMLSFTALLSANLAVFNLLPLPALDGGRLLFLIIEALRGKPVDQEKEGMVHFVGFVLLMVFAIFVAYNDIVRLFQR